MKQLQEKLNPSIVTGAGKHGFPSIYLMTQVKKAAAATFTDQPDSYQMMALTVAGYSQSSQCF